MTSGHFKSCLIAVFASTIEECRQDLAHDNKAFPLMDGLGSHHTDQCLTIWPIRNIAVLVLFSHTSDQIQSVNLLTFVPARQVFSASKFNRLENLQSDKVVRMLDMWFGSTAPDHSVEAFPEQPHTVRESLESEPTIEVFLPDSHHRFQLQTGV
jgi:hypothetical protein